MKKNFTFLTAFLFFALCSYSQYYYNTPAITPSGNPGGLNTTNEEPYQDGLHPSWTNIQPSGSNIWTSVKTIPFTFEFNGTVVSQYKASTFGIVTFDVTSALPNNIGNITLPSSVVPDKSICILGLVYSGTSSNDKIVSNTFGTAPNRQHWIFYASYNSNASGNYCWTYWSIVLEETTNRIYIVDQRSSTKWSCEPDLTLGVQINSSSAEMVSGSPNIHPLAGKSKYPYDNVYYEFIPGTRPVYDLAVDWIQTGGFLALNSGPFEIRGILENFGAVVVNTYDINYQISSGPILTEHVSSTGIPLNGDEWYFHDSLWMPPVTGTYLLSVWASNINGHPDDNNFNDTLKKVIEVKPIFTSKVQLYEVFTSSTNIDCNAGNAHLKSILDNHAYGYNLIKYQMDYPGLGDIYYTAECGVRKTYYGIDSIPDMFVNGQHHIAPDFLSEQLFSDYEAPAYMHLSVSHTKSGQDFNVTFNIIPFVDFQNVTAYIAIVENQTSNNVGTNGETTFYSVMKKMLPDADGQAIASLQSAIPKTISKSYTFTTGHTVENFNNLSIVAFVQDNATKEVLQSALSVLVGGFDDMDNTGNGIIGLFPNPARSQTNIKYLLTDKYGVKIEVYNLIGEVVYSEDKGINPAGTYTSQINTSNLPSGIYNLNLTIGDFNYSKKLSVTK